MPFRELSESELEVMEALWEKGKATSFGELLEYFNDQTDKGWKKQTFNTFLFRMQQKDFIQTIVDGKYKKYMPTMTKEEYQIAKSEAFLNKNYQGSIVNMITAFSGGDKLSKKEIAELKQLLEEWGEE